MLNYENKIKIFERTKTKNVKKIEQLILKKIASFKNEKNSLIIFSIFIQKIFFCESLFII